MKEVAESLAPLDFEELYIFMLFCSCQPPTHLVNSYQSHISVLPLQAAVISSLNSHQDKYHCFDLAFHLFYLFQLSQGQRRVKDPDEHHHAAEENLQPSLHLPAH